MSRQLDPSQIAQLSSPYIDRGVKQDAWEIESLVVDGSLLTARLKMTSFFVSPTDPGGFHLTIFAAQEFLAQLANIYLHLVAGYEVKTRETWMRESTIVSRASIRDPERIEVEMDFFKHRWSGETLVALARCRIFDDQGGLFTAKLRGLLR